MIALYRFLNGKKTIMNCPLHFTILLSHGLVHLPSHCKVFGFLLKPGRQVAGDLVVVVKIAVVGLLETMHK